MENRELTLAALMLDFPRFYGKPGKEFIQCHETIFHRFYDVGHVLDLIEKASICDNDIANYVGNEVEVRILIDARRLSLVETQKTDIHSLSKNLTTVFSRIRFSDDNDIPRFRYPFKAKACDSIFPKEIDNQDLKSYVDDFSQEMQELEENCSEDYSVFETVFLNLLERYLWCITASDNEGEDISLYSHMKNTAVIAQCKWQNRDSTHTDEYCFVMADFSGIQKYIFSINNMNEAGVSNRLRARSFIVDELVTVLAHIIIHRFDVSIMNILMLTGGKFYILLPNKGNTADETLLGIRNEFNKTLYDQYKGLIAVNLVWISGSDELLENYSNTVMSLSEKLSDEKLRNFSLVLSDEDGWNEDKFILYDDLCDKKVCSSCGLELVRRSSDPREQQYCENCRIHTSLGRELPKAKYILYTKEKPQFSLYEDYGISLYEDFPDKKGYYIEKINDTILIGKEYAYPTHYRFVANHIPVKNGKPLSFKEIADCSQGRKLLGAFKADVDSLGFVFGMGLRDPDDKNRHYGTISRVDTMSKLFNSFFSGYMIKMINSKSDYGNIYCVFSGGDDVFLLGPWNVLLDFARDIQQEFGRFSGKNPNLTISAGIELFSPRTHISYIADHTEESLENAKRFPNESAEKYIYPNKKGRNSIVCMGRVFSWEAFAEEWGRAVYFTQLFREKYSFRRSFTSGKMRKILEFSKMYQEFLKTKDVTKLMFCSLMEYEYTRNYSNNDDIELNQYINDLRYTDKEWIEYIKGLEKNAANYKHKKANLFYADFTMYAISLLGKENEE